MTDDILPESFRTALSALRQAKKEVLMDLSLRVNKEAEGADWEERRALELVLRQILEMVRENIETDNPEQRV